MRLAGSSPSPTAAADWAAADLFAFDDFTPAGWANARVSEVVPVAAVEAAELLNLVAKAAWPPDHPVSLALKRESAGRMGQAVAAPSSRVGIWYLSSGRGIQGYLNGYHVLLGNEQLMRDWGMPISPATRSRLDAQAARGWQSVLVGARATGSHGDQVHRSLIGIVAIAAAGKQTQIEPTTNGNDARLALVGTTRAWPARGRLVKPTGTWMPLILLAMMATAGSLYFAWRESHWTAEVVPQRASPFEAHAGPVLNPSDANPAKTGSTSGRSKVESVFNRSDVEPAGPSKHLLADSSNKHEPEGSLKAVSNSESTHNESRPAPVQEVAQGLLSMFGIDLMTAPQATRPAANNLLFAD